VKLSVIAVDYDGTLTTTGSVDACVRDAIAHARVRDAIAHVRRSGISVLLVTGRILADLRRVRADGYAQTSEEMSLGACSVAVPVRSPDGTVVAACGIVVASLKRDRARLVAALQVAAQGITRSLAQAVPLSESE